MVAVAADNVPMMTRVLCSIVKNKNDFLVVDRTLKKHSPLFSRYIFSCHFQQKPLLKNSFNLLAFFYFFRLSPICANI